ncbi:MAG TPA: hypothetical protein VKG26_08035 [Bacteroidia bacterium]|nr:hypothetical protein [Bacteroidia bacterium]
MKNLKSNSNLQEKNNLPVRFVFQMTEDQLEQKLFSSLKKYFSKVTAEKDKQFKEEIRLYSRYAAARLFDVDPQTISEWVTHKIISEPLVFGKRKYFSHDQLIEEIKKRQQTKNK